LTVFIPLKWCCLIFILFLHVNYIQDHVEVTLCPCLGARRRKVDERGEFRTFFLRKCPDSDALSFPSNTLNMYWKTSTFSFPLNLRRLAEYSVSHIMKLLWKMQNLLFPKIGKLKCKLNSGLFFWSPLFLYWQTFTLSFSFKSHIQVFSSINFLKHIFRWRLHAPVHFRPVAREPEESLS